MKKFKTFTEIVDEQIAKSGLSNDEITEKYKSLYKEVKRETGLKGRKLRRKIARRLKKWLSAG